MFHPISINLCVIRHRAQSEKFTCMRLGVLNLNWICGVVDCELQKYNHFRLHQALNK